MFDPVLDAVLDALDPFALASPVRTADGSIVDFRVELVNRSAATAFGRSPEELVGLRLSELEDRARADDLFTRLRTLVETARPFTEDLAWARAEAARTMVIRFDPLGDLVLLRGSLMGSDQGMARRAAAAAQQRYRILAEMAADLVFEADPDGVITWASPSIAEITGRQPDDIAGRPAWELWRVDHAERAELGDELERTDCARRALRLVHADGTERWTKVTVRAVVDHTGAVTGYIASGVDIQAELDARDALAESEARYRLIAELASDVVMRFDAHRVIEWVSPSVTTVLGWAPDDVIGQPIERLVHPAEVHRAAEVDVVLGRGESYEFEGRLMCADGTHRWFDVSLHPVFDDDGRVVGRVGGLHDISAAVRARAVLAYQATHDPLTQVANRSDLYGQIGEMLVRRPRSGDRLGVLFIDVDRLKVINDTLGHAAGDRVLVAVASRVRGLVRTDDVVARFGGDEFVVLLAGLHDAHDAEAIAAKIHGAMTEPVDVDGGAVPVTVSIGVALAEPGSDPDTALSRADAALYRAKAAGRNTTAHDALS